MTTDNISVKLRNAKIFAKEYLTEDKYTLTFTGEELDFIALLINETIQNKMTDKLIVKICNAVINQKGNQ